VTSVVCCAGVTGDAYFLAFAGHAASALDSIACTCYLSWKDDSKLPAMYCTACLSYLLPLPISTSPGLFRSGYGVPSPPLQAFEAWRMCALRALQPSAAVTPGTGDALPFILLALSRAASTFLAIAFLWHAVCILEGGVFCSLLWQQCRASAAYMVLAHAGGRLCCRRLAAYFVLSRFCLRAGTQDPALLLAAASHLLRLLYAGCARRTGHKRLRCCGAARTNDAAWRAFSASGAAVGRRFSTRNS